MMSDKTVKWLDETESSWLGEFTMRVWMGYCYGVAINGLNIKSFASNNIIFFNGWTFL